VHLNIQGTVSKEVAMLMTSLGIERCVFIVQSLHPFIVMIGETNRVRKGFREIHVYTYTSIRGITS
jgi:hypothetical protein